MPPENIPDIRGFSLGWVERATFFDIYFLVA
jgi:hypothetical protein